VWGNGPNVFAFTFQELSDGVHGFASPYVLLSPKRHGLSAGEFVKILNEHRHKPFATGSQTDTTISDHLTLR
jgi:hypothetical protein